MKFYATNEPHWWCNGYHGCHECSRSWIIAPVTSSQKLYHCYLLLLCLELRIKSKVWTARNHDNVSQWSNMSTRRLLLQLASIIKIQVDIVQCGHDITITKKLFK